MKNTQEIKDSIQAITDSRHERALAVHDSATGIFLARELEVLMARSYEVKYPEFKARQFFPKDSEVGNIDGMESYTFKLNGATGEAGLGDLDGAAPLADVNTKPTTASITNIKLGMEYSTQAVTMAAKLGESLPDAKMKAVVRGIEKSLDSLAWFGNENFNIKGVFSSDIPVTTKATWANLTGSELADVVQAYVKENFEQMNTEATTLLLPAAEFKMLDAKMEDTLNAMTAKQWILANTTLNKIDFVPQLKGAGVSDTNRIFLMNDEGDYAPTLVMEEIKWLPAQAKDYGIRTPAYMPCGGVKVVYPLAHSIFDVPAA